MEQQLQTFIDEKYLWKPIDNKIRKNLLKDIRKIFKTYKFTDKTTNEMIQDGTIFIECLEPTIKKVWHITIHNASVKIN